MEVHGGADTHPAACGGSYARVGGHALKEAATHREPTQEGASSWQKLQLVDGSPQTGAGLLAGVVTLKGCTPWKGPMLEQLLKNCSLREGPTGTGKNGVGMRGEWF